VTFKHAIFAGRRVEARHGRVRHGSTPERIDAPSISILAFAGLPFIPAVNHLPKTIWLRRHHAWAAEFVTEEPTRGQGLIANLLGFQPDMRATCEQAVVRIALQ